MMKAMAAQFINFESKIYKDYVLTILPLASLTRDVLLILNPKTEIDAQFNIHSVFFERIPYFKALLSHKSSKYVVELPRISPQAFANFIEYIY